jgi:hypothetical protein
MIEEDVFIPDIDTIKNLDLKYPIADLLCASNNIKNTRFFLDWHWKKVVNKINLPWSRSMICAIRISRKMINSIEKYAMNNKTLFLDEAMFTTLALHDRLIIINPVELSSIVWKRDWKKDEINKSYLYHPVKNIDQQISFRQ